MKKYMGVAFYHMLGLAFPILVSIPYEYFRGIYSVYLRHALTILIIGILIYILLGCYIAAHRLVIQHEKLFVKIVMCLLYFLLTIPAYHARFLIVPPPRWLVWLVDTVKFQVWLVLFGYYLAQIPIELLKQRKRAKNIDLIDA